MKNFKLLLIPILFCLGVMKTYAQDVEVPFSWSTVIPSFTSSTGFWQCGTVNVTLNTGSTLHYLDAPITKIPTGGTELIVPITLTFSKPVCNLSVLIGDLDELPGGGSPNEWIEFIDAPLPIGVESTFAGTPFILDDAGGTLIADPDGFMDTEAWVIWNGPMTEVTFNYHREGEYWGMTLDSLRFDCDCSIPTNLNCCEGSGWQTLTWDEIPGVDGYEIEFGFNDSSSGCCDSVTGLPSGWLEEVTDNVFLVPEWFEDCFWWRVRSIMTDETTSEWSERMCDCLEDTLLPCVPPINLDCNVTSSGARTISWDPVPGALGYEVCKVFNDPTCCPTGPDPIETVVVSTTNTFLTESNTNLCYTWKVRTICTDDPTFSEWSEIKCSEDCTFPTAKSSANRSKLIDGYPLSSASLEITIVPNPADEFVTISLQGSADEEITRNTILSITSAEGTEVYRGRISINSSKQIKINNLSPGLYLCTILNGDVVLSSDRLIIK